MVGAPKVSPQLKFSFFPSFLLFFFLVSGFGLGFLESVFVCVRYQVFFLFVKK